MANESVVVGDFLKPVPRQRLHETIAARLEEMILGGHFQPSAPLPTEAEMASQFVVSRTVVRDAIRVLATKGLVHIRHGVGTFVTRSGRERLGEALELSLRRGDYSPWELYIIRHSLELIVVEEAIQKATAEHIALMRQALAHLRHDMEYAPQAMLTVDQHTIFHQLMVRSTGNRVLMDLLEPITVFRIPSHVGMTERQLATLPVYTPEAIAAYIAQHERIVAAIEQRSLQAARAAMIDHLKDLEDRVRRGSEARTESR